MTWAIAELLAEHAGRVTVSNPMRTRAIASAKVKTDKIDARVLAQLGAADFLPEVWAPDEATRALRRRIAHRSSLVCQRTPLARGQKPRPALRAAPAGLDATRRPTRDQPRRAHQTTPPGGLEPARDREAGRPGLIRRAARARQPRHELRHLRRAARQPPP